MELEKIEVTDADLGPLIKADAERYNIPEDKIRNIYEKNHEIRHKIQEDKIIKLLTENAKIKEVEKTKEEQITT
jgi:hypothetical protein